MENNQNIEKKNIWQKELSLKETILYFGIFVLLIIYTLFFIYPQYSNYKNSISDLQSIKSEIDNYESKINTLPQLENQLSSLKGDIEEKSKILSSNMEDGMFLVGLSNLMANLGVEMVSYTVDDTIQFGNFYAIPTSIEVRGNYIRKIMNYLEKQDNLTQILDYNMETYIEEVEVLIEETEDENQSNSEIKNEPIVSDTVEQKATGLITAKFKFVMYSANNPTDQLENGDASKWMPGKYNPFTSTTK